MYLNPLLKVDDLNEDFCTVKLLLDKKSYKINTKLFLTIIDNYQDQISEKKLVDCLINFSNNREELVDRFIRSLRDNKILLDDISDYPVEQIEHWKDRKWLNALIYHLESQNITCFDDGTKEGSDLKKEQYDITSGVVNIWKTYDIHSCIELPDPDFSMYSDISFEETLLRRNSFSPFTKTPIDLIDFSTIMAAANQDLIKSRTSLEKSPENLYKSSFVAFETYVFCFSINDLETGLYHYNPKHHNLSLLEIGNYSEKVTEMCIGQRRASMGGCLFLLVANTERYMERYKHERAYRNMLVNVAEFAQQYIFYSTALGYSTFLTPAIKDDYAARLLNIDGFLEMPLYTVAIG